MLVNLDMFTAIFRLLQQIKIHIYTISIYIYIYYTHNNNI